MISDICDIGKVSVAELFHVNISCINSVDNLGALLLQSESWRSTNSYRGGEKYAKNEFASFETFAFQNLDNLNFVG